MRRLRELWIAAWAAVQFLTTLPPLLRRPFTPQEIGRAMGFYPLVGALLGLMLLGLDALLALAFPAGVVAALLLTAWVLLSGALHLDGFVDSCDGLLGGWTPQRRLEIMHDVGVGAFGLAGGVLLLLLKYAGLAALVASPDRRAALLLVPTLGRWSMTLSIVVFPYARAKGLGRAVKDHAGRFELALATALALLVAGLVAGGLGLLALAVAALAAWALARFALARLPGLTGDLYGATCEVVELATLLFFTLGL